MDKKEAFIKVIKQNEAFIHKIAAVYTNNPEDKNDLIQDIIYQLWKSFDSFRKESAISTWLYRIALNVSIYQLKLKKRRISTVELEDEITTVADQNHQQKEEQWILFREQLNRLNLLEQAIVMLYLDNKSYEEIAEIIGISPSNVGTKFSRIKEKIRTNISKQL